MRWDVYLICRLHQIIRHACLKEKLWTGSGDEVVM